MENVNSNMDSIKDRLKTLETENAILRKKLEYESAKHKDWKKLAMSFHDTLWKMIDHYMIAEKNHG